MARPRTAQSGGPDTCSRTRTAGPTPITAGVGIPAAASARSPSASWAAGYGQRLMITSRPSARVARWVEQMYPPPTGDVETGPGTPAGQSLVHSRTPLVAQG